MAGHAAVEAARRLHTIATELLGEDINVGFGPVPGPTESLDSLGIAYSTDEFGVVSGSTEYSGLQSQHDTIDISCLAMSVSGDEDDAAARLERCFDLMGQLGRAVLADRAAAAAPSGLVPAGLVDTREAGITWSGITRYQTQWIGDERTGLTGAQILFTLAVAAHGPATTG